MPLAETDRGPIFTDEASPGYVWLACAHYGLPDNTASQIGYFVCYRPLARHANGLPRYAGNEAITPAMCADIQAYYAAHAVQQGRHPSPLAPPTHR